MFFNKEAKEVSFCDLCDSGRVTVENVASPKEASRIAAPLNKGFVYLAGPILGPNILATRIIGHFCSV